MDSYKSTYGVASLPAKTQTDENGTPLLAKVQTDENGTPLLNFDTLSPSAQARYAGEVDFPFEISNGDFTPHCVVQSTENSSFSDDPDNEEFTKRVTEWLLANGVTLSNTHPQ